VNGKRYTNNLSNKGLVAQMYKELHLLQLNTKKIPKMSIEKMGRKHEQIFLQRRHLDGQKTHKKMFNIIHPQGNANQNYNEISPHTCQNH